MIIIETSPLLKQNREGFAIMSPHIEAVASNLKEFEKENDLRLTEWKNRPVSDFIKDVQTFVPNGERTRNAGFLATRQTDLEKFRAAMLKESWLQHDKKFAGLLIELEKYPVLVSQQLAAAVINSVSDLDKLLHVYPLKLTFWKSLSIAEDGKVIVEKDAIEKWTAKYTLYASDQQQAILNEASKLLGQVTAFEKKFSLRAGFFSAATSIDSTGAYTFDKLKLKAL